jgi:hypothetical protein
MALNADVLITQREAKMGATLILNPERIEATGTTFEYELDPIAGFGQVKDVVFMAKIHKVRATSSTLVGSPSRASS